MENKILQFDCARAICEAPTDWNCDISISISAQILALRLMRLPTKNRNVADLRNEIAGKIYYRRQLLKARGYAVGDIDAILKKLKHS